MIFPLELFFIDFPLRRHSFMLIALCLFIFYVLVTCYRLWYLNCQKCDYVID